jgi:outer membrane protein assembly factor BamB
MKKILIVALALLAIFNGCKKSIQPVWMLKLKSRSYTKPMIHDGRFFVFSQAGEAVCGDLKRGTVLWKEVLPDAILGDPALSDDDTLYVVTQKGLFYAMDARTGRTKWRLDLHDSFIAPVTTAGSIVLLPSESGTLYARSRSDGSEIWKFSGAVKFNAGATLFSNYILIGGWSKDFYCLRTDGTLNWKFTASDRITNRAIAQGNSVYFPAYDQFVYSLDIPSGRMQWRFPVEHPSNLIVTTDTIFFASTQDLVALSARSGKLIQKRASGKTIDRLYQDPSGLLIISSNVYRIKFDFTDISLLFRGLQPIFKLNSSEGMILATDDLYSIYGYEQAVH